MGWDGKVEVSLEKGIGIIRLRGAARDELSSTALFLLLVALGVFFVLLSATFPNHGRNCQLVATAAELKHGKEKLLEGNRHLLAEIEALRSDTFYIEAVARQRYRLVKPGEVLIEFEAAPAAAPR